MSGDPHRHAHGHGHGAHGHRHGHGHGHGGESARIGFAFWLNASFALVELVGGLLTNSVAILADALHDLGDSAAIGLGWMAARGAGRAPDLHYTYGYRRLSLLSAAVNGAILVVGSIGVIALALPRLWEPVLPHTTGMFGFALLGLVVNGAGALRLRKGRTLNERMLSWHLIEDTLGWFAVLVASVVIHFTGWAVLDPLLSLAVAALILVNVVRNLRATVRLFLQRTPDPQLAGTLRETLEALPEVDAAHHLHLWSLDGEHHVLTTHLRLARELGPAEQRALKERIDAALHGFGLAHTTIELELPDETCRDQRSAAPPSAGSAGRRSPGEQGDHPHRHE